jgi:hypothetical protein
VIAGYCEVDGRLLPIVVVEHSSDVTVRVRTCRIWAHLFGVFGDTFIAGSFCELGAAIARNVAAAYRPGA